MSQFLRAMRELSDLSRRADVVGQMRVTFTFDSESDRARFKVEVARNVGKTIMMPYHSGMDLHEATIYGVKVRIL